MISIYNEDCIKGMSKLKDNSVACLKHGRKFIGYELDKSYFEIAEERIKEVV